MKKNIDDMINDNKEHGKLSLIFIIIVLVIIIILLLWGYSRASLTTDKVPTGNIDVFDLECKSCNNTCNNTTKPDNEKIVDDVIDVPDDETDDKKEDDIKENPIDETIPGFNIFDNDIKWEAESTLRIFDHAAYDFSSIIAPGSSNSYVFRVRNNNDFKVVYSITFEETNDYNINLNYKLSYKNNFIAGSDNAWVKYDELNIENKVLDKYSYDEYVLDWKWIDSNNDTEIGASDGASYNLGIEIIGVEYDE